MKDFFKYLALGLLGLSLNVALPRLPVDWTALALVPTYLSGARRLSSWAVLLALAWAASAFSLDTAFAFAWPWALAWLLGLGLRKSFQWEGTEERAVVLALLVLLPGLSAGFLAWFRDGVWLLDGHDALAALSTFALGFFGLPLCSLLLSALRRRLGAWLPRRSGMDLTHADWLAAKGARLSRKPFGLEKGL